MARRLARMTEVARRRHERTSEDQAPHPIDHHPGNQGILGSADRLRQFAAPAPLAEWGGWIFGENSQRAPLHDWPFALHVASQENGQVLHLPVYDDVQGVWIHFIGVCL